MDKSSIITTELASIGYSNKRAVTKITEMGEPNPHIRLVTMVVTLPEEEIKDEARAYELPIDAKLSQLHPRIIQEAKSILENPIHPK
jgi:hypothetical protein